MLTETEEDLNKWKDISIHGQGRPDVKRQYFNSSTVHVQSKSLPILVSPLVVCIRSSTMG